MGWFSASGKDDADFKNNVRKKVAKEFDVDANEVVLKDNGDVVIDRRAKASWAQPMKVGDWRKRS